MIVYRKIQVIVTINGHMTSHTRTFRHALLDSGASKSATSFLRLVGGIAGPCSTAARTFGCQGAGSNRSGCPHARTAWTAMTLGLAGSHDARRTSLKPHLPWRRSVFSQSQRQRCVEDVITDGISKWLFQALLEVLRRRLER